MTDPKPGAIVHAEFSSTDLAATRKFMEGVFGWKFKKEAMGDMEYWTFDAGSGPMGGIMNPMPGMSPGTLNYILVDSIDASIKKITGHGGKVLMGKQEIPTIGWFAVYEVPGGFVQAIYQSARKP